MVTSKASWFVREGFGRIVSVLADRICSFKSVWTCSIIFSSLCRVSFEANNDQVDRFRVALICLSDIPPHLRLCISSLRELPRLWGLPFLAFALMERVPV